MGLPLQEEQRSAQQVDTGPGWWLAGSGQRLGHRRYESPHAPAPGKSLVGVISLSELQDGQERAIRIRNGGPSGLVRALRLLLTVPKPGSKTSATRCVLRSTRRMNASQESNPEKHRSATTKTLPGLDEEDGAPPPG